MAGYSILPYLFSSMMPMEASSRKQIKEKPQPTATMKKMS
jgi:hypothetical protein